MQKQPITIKPTDEFTVVITGADYAAIDAAVKKLPYDIAMPILASLETQIVNQTNQSNQTEP